MNIIILGDKFQKRMKSKGCVALIENNKKPVVHNQYHTLKHIFPQANIIYIYGFEAKKFQNYIDKNYKEYPDLKIIYNSHYDNYNSSYSLSLASDFLDSNCLIMFGDIVLNKNLFAKFNIDNNSQVFLSHNKTYKLGCTIADSGLCNIDYDLNNYLYNIYYVQNIDGKNLKNIVKNSNYYNCFVFELMNKLIEENIIIKPLFIDSKKRATV
jgi:CTP:phosphocholine cytidylyltransferase-like protein